MDLSEDGRASLRVRNKDSILLLGTRKKRASSSTRKASETSIASQASLRSATTSHEEERSVSFDAQSVGDVNSITGFTEVCDS